MTCPTLQDCQTLQANADALEIATDALFQQYELSYTLMLQAQLDAANCWEDLITCGEGGEGESLVVDHPDSEGLEYIRGRQACLGAMLGKRESLTDEQVKDVTKFLKRSGLLK